MQRFFVKEGPWRIMFCSQFLFSSTVKSNTFSCQRTWWNTARQHPQAWWKNEADHQVTCLSLICKNYRWRLALILIYMDGTLMCIYMQLMVGIPITFQSVQQSCSIFLHTEKGIKFQFAHKGSYPWAVRWGLSAMAGDCLGELKVTRLLSVKLK